MSHLMHICGIQNNGIDELTGKTEIETQIQRTNIWKQSGEMGGSGMNWEIGITYNTIGTRSKIYN